MIKDQNEMFVTLDGLVGKDHPYRRFASIIDFDSSVAPPECALFGPRSSGVGGKAGLLNVGAPVYRGSFGPSDGTLHAGESCGQMVL